MSVTSFFLFLCIIVSLAVNPAARFDQNEALQQVHLSFAAYCGNKVDANWDCYWCKKQPGVRWIGNFGEPGGNEFGYVAIDKNNTINLIWRGTDNIRGWLSDFDIIHSDYMRGPQGASVHQGFYKLMNKSSTHIATLITKAVRVCPACRKLVVSGHSLGAAMSLLSALELSARPDLMPYPISLYTFGCPRVGNKIFADWASDQFDVLWRMSHNRDPVPHTPLEAMNYYHTSREIFTDEPGTKYTICSDSEGEDPNGANKQKILNPFDHAAYMGVNVLAGVPSGCLFFDSIGKNVYIDEL